MSDTTGDPASGFMGATARAWANVVNAERARHTAPTPAVDDLALHRLGSQRVCQGSVVMRLRRRRGRHWTGTPVAEIVGRLEVLLSARLPSGDLVLGLPGRTYGVGAVGASDPAFSNHFHLPVTAVVDGVLEDDHGIVITARRWPA